MHRFLLAAAAIAAFGCAAGAQDALSFDDPADVVQMLRKVHCSTVDGEPQIYFWEGEAYSRRQGERDKKLFAVEGMNVRHCVAHEDPARGAGARLITRELLIYLDPETKDVLTTWTNPWTNEALEVQHVANDPVNAGFYPKDRSGAPTTFGGNVIGAQWHQNFNVPLYYPNPLAGAYEAEIGGTYHATEMFNFFGDVDALVDPAVTSVPAFVGWTRVSDWLPWMKMSGREGVIYFSSAGRKLDSFDQLSDTLKSEIAAHYPDYASPPPADDDRPNMTSWKYYKAVKDGLIVAPKRTPAE